MHVQARVQNKEDGENMQKPARLHHRGTFSRRVICLGSGGEPKTARGGGGYFNA